MTTSEERLDWHIIRGAFEATLELDGEAREAELSRCLAGQPELAVRVRALLDAACAQPSDLDCGALELLEPASDFEARDLSGQMAAGYTICRRISAGGMGEVWLATRDVAGSQRRVALKVLKRGLDTDAFLERFRAEVQTLASLHHEGIVAFLDTGALADGRPFLVMEHVAGLSITEHAERHVKDLRGRLALFVKACAPVRFAHANLVLHRDLKPANILVTAEGAPKLLDFGIAKLLAPEATSTARTLRLITPRYACPEQWRGERCGVATDVYGLGLVLYELLVEQPAFPDRNLTAALGQFEFELPRLPSAAARDKGRRRMLRGDLDAIVMQALQPEPGRRFASVEALEDDVRRYLAGQTITARRSSRRDRIVKLVRRRRWASLALALGITALTSGMVGLWSGKRRAELDAGHGWGAHNQAAQAARFLEDLLVETEARDSTSLHEQSLQERLTVLSAAPEAEARVRIALGRAALSRRRFAEARDHFQRALRLAESQRCLGDRDWARTELLLGRAQAALGDPDARRALLHAVSDYAALAPADPTGLSEARRAVAALAAAPTSNP